MNADAAKPLPLPNKDVLRATRVLAAITDARARLHGQFVGAPRCSRHGCLNDARASHVGDYTGGVCRLHELEDAVQLLIQAQEVGASVALTQEESIALERQAMALLHYANRTDGE